MADMAPQTQQDSTSEQRPVPNGAYFIRPAQRGDEIITPACYRGCGKSADEIRRPAREGYFLLHLHDGSVIELSPERKEREWLPTGSPFHFLPREPICVRK